MKTKREYIIRNGKKIYINSEFYGAMYADDPIDAANAIIAILLLLIIAAVGISIYVWW